MLKNKNSNSKNYSIWFFDKNKLKFSWLIYIRIEYLSLYQLEYTISTIFIHSPQCRLKSYININSLLLENNDKKIKSSQRAIFFSPWVFRFVFKFLYCWFAFSRREFFQGIDTLCTERRRTRYITFYIIYIKPFQVSTREELGVEYSHKCLPLRSLH